MRLFRLVDDEWTALETTAQGDAVYTVETPGLSYFAVSHADAGASDAENSSSADDSDTGGDGAGAGDGSGTDDDAGSGASGESGEGSDGGAGAPIIEEQTPGFGPLAAVAAALLACRR
ncbi:hypothetical protein ABNG03_18025 [Halorubrum sp. RMP-47]|uniref:PGF-CTERM sorting domain-containing protein n=1 Tax=Halorubrum miltondacostae TaxID=3076378 RepID=A0ABD5M3L5_9EURY